MSLSSCAYTQKFTIHHIQFRTEQTPLTNLGKYLFWLLPLPLDSFIRCGVAVVGGCGLLVDDVVIPNIMKGLLFCVSQAPLDIRGWLVWWVWHTCIR